MISLTAADAERMMKKIRPKMIFYYLQMRSHQRSPVSAAVGMKYCLADYSAPEEEAG